jgi:hypothetical protein
MGEARPGETPTSSAGPRQQGGRTAQAAPRPCASQRPREAFAPAPFQSLMVTAAESTRRAVAVKHLVRLAQGDGTVLDEGRPSGLNKPAGRSERGDCYEVFIY